jgi:hypothetical protein
MTYWTDKNVKIINYVVDNKKRPSHIFDNLVRGEWEICGPFTKRAIYFWTLNRLFTTVVLVKKMRECCQFSFSFLEPRVVAYLIESYLRTICHPGQHPSVVFFYQVVVFILYSSLT